jgi:hypothetical protein
MTKCNACGSTIDIGCRAVFVHDGKEDLIFCDNNECMRDYYRRNPTIDMEMDGETADEHISRLESQNDIYEGRYEEEESLEDIEKSALTVRDLI